MPNSSPELSPTSAGPVEAPRSPGRTDFTDAQLKPAPLRLTRKSNSSGGQSDNSLSPSNSSGRTPNGTNRDNRESLNTIMHRAATPSTFRTAPSHTSPRLASLVSKFKILDVMGNTDAGTLRLPSPEKAQKPPRVPTPTPDEPQLRRAAHIALTTSSQAQRRVRSQGVASGDKFPTASEPKQWDPSGVAERRKLFESGSTVPRPFDSPLVTPIVTRAVARVPSQGEQKRRDSDIVKSDQSSTFSAQRSVAAQVSAPALSSQQSATEGVRPDRERRKSVAALRMSFERSSLPHLRPETPSSAHRPLRPSLNQGLSTATKVPPPVTPSRRSKDPITPTRVRNLRSSEVFAQTYPRLEQATSHPVHGVDSSASSRLKQTQLHNTASRLAGSHDGNVSDAEWDSPRPVTRKNNDTPTRTSGRTSTRRPSSHHPLLLSRTLSVKITTGPQTMVTLQQPWANSSGSLPLTTSHSHGYLDQRKSKSGRSSDSSASAPLAPANRVKDLQKVFDNNNNNNPSGPGSAPFLPFIQKRRAQTLALGVPAKSSPSAPMMVSTTVAVTTRKASRRSSQQQQQQESSDMIPETASSTASSVIHTRKRSKTLPSSLGEYRRKTSGPTAAIGSLGYTSYFQRRKIKKQQKQSMKRLAAGKDSPVKERISLFEQLGGGSNHGHSRNGRNGCGSIVSLPLSMHSKGKSSDTTSSSQSRSDRSSRNTHQVGFGSKGRGSSSSGSRVMRVLSFGTSGNGNGNRSSRNAKVLRAAGRKISNAVSMSMSKRKDSGDGDVGERKGKGKLKESNGTKGQPLVLSSTNKETGESTFFVKGVLWKVSGSHGDLDLNVAVEESQRSPEEEERKRNESTTETTTTSFPSTRASAAGSGSGEGSSGSAGAMARHPVLQHWPHSDRVSRTVPHHDGKSYGSLSVDEDSVAPEWSRGLDDDNPFLQPTRQPQVVTGGSSSKIKKSATAPNHVGGVMPLCRKRGFLPTRRSHGDVVEAARGPSTLLRKSFTMAVLPRLASGNSSNDDYSQDGDEKQKGNKLTKEKGKEVRSTWFPPRQSSISWGQRAAAAAFGIGQRLKEGKGSGRSSSLLGKGGVEAGTGTGATSSANSDVAVPATTTTATVPIRISTLTTESLRHDE
ncbi:hypothetical protein QBC32DRAFT_378574 [Pseudoneurospora amorphoporcata]|uniref:Uncharacterized protein n=1 Tax=Pseudoneurospora amorphoporcata TaxID=241081 RepID=A0AAN6SDS0_9PEZI|nr:hypothetical protein QBC32DRAFT_378574 [Pseudoneurospora amorphoporcata]